MSNKSMGNHFETKFCEILSQFGFWAHNFRQDVSGQPADVIAAKRGKTYLIDCKVCSNDGFALSRMEENQDLSMTLWEECGNGPAWFAVLCREQIYFFSHKTIQELQETKSVLRFEDFPKYGIPMGGWLDKCV